MLRGFTQILNPIGKARPKPGKVIDHELPQKAQDLLLIAAFTAVLVSAQVQTIQAPDQTYDQSETEYCCRKDGPPAEIREKKLPDHDRQHYTQQETKQFDDVHLKLTSAPYTFPSRVSFLP